MGSLLGYVRERLVMLKVSIHFCDIVSIFLMLAVVSAPNNGGSAASTPPVSFPGISAVPIPKTGQSTHDGIARLRAVITS